MSGDCRALALAVAAGLAGCTSTQSPVLYPNAYLQQVGQEPELGGTAGAVHGAAKQTQPSPVYKNFVNRCLREKGYEVIG